LGKLATGVVGAGVVGAGVVGAGVVGAGVVGVEVVGVVVPPPQATSKTRPRTRIAARDQSAFLFIVTSLIYTICRVFNGIRGLSSEGFHHPKFITAIIPQV